MPEKTVATLIPRFIKNNTPQSIELEEKFSRIKENRWTPNTVLHEIGVQLGQLMSILNNSKASQEEGRTFNDISDELCDIALQLIYLTSALSLNLESISKEERYINFDSTNLFDLYPLYGQITEAFLEEENNRYAKPREGFATRLDFIKDRIVKMYIIIFNYAEENNIDMNKRYRAMCTEATRFVHNKTRKERGSMIKRFKSKDNILIGDFDGSLGHI